VPPSATDWQPLDPDHIESLDQGQLVFLRWKPVRVPAVGPVCRFAGLGGISGLTPFEDRRSLQPDS